MPVRCDPEAFVNSFHFTICHPICINIGIRYLKNMTRKVGRPRPTRLYKKKKTTFLCLPLEIRHKIYDYLISLECQTDCYGISGWYTKGQFQHRILLTCRQCRDEAATILYGNNTFFILHSCEPTHFVSRIVVTNTAFVQRLAFYATNNDISGTVDALAVRMPHLKHITLLMWRAVEQKAP